VAGADRFAHADALGSDRGRELELAAPNTLKAGPGGVKVGGGGGEGRE